MVYDIGLAHLGALGGEICRGLLDIRGLIVYIERGHTYLARKTKLLIDRDRLFNADRKDVARTTVEVFDRVQTKPKANQLLALTCAFILMCEALGVDLNDAYVASYNIMADKVNPTGRGEQFDAMKFHLATEVTQDGDVLLGVER